MTGSQAYKKAPAPTAPRRKTEMDTRMEKKRKVAKGNLISVLAAQTAASVNVVDMKVREIDAEIEEELQYESRKLTGSIARLRHRVEHLTHHKAALFTTVALNLCDAVLVVLELIYDFLFFTGGLEHANKRLTKNNETNVTQVCYDEDGHYKHYAHYSHYCHYASVGILSVLMLIVLAHIFGSGKRFFKYKLHTLDFTVIVIAWTVDVVTIKGIHKYDHYTAIVLLMLLLLLRIVRVLNSLIVIVMDGMRVQLRLMFTQKKRITEELEVAELRNARQHSALKHVKEYCVSKGLDPEVFDRIVGDDLNNNAQKGMFNMVTRGMKNTGAMMYSGGAKVISGGAKVISEGGTKVISGARSGAKVISEGGTRVMSGARMVGDAALKLAKRPQSGISTTSRGDGENPGETTFTFVPEVDESGVFDQPANRTAADELAGETSVHIESKEE